MTISNSILLEIRDLTSKMVEVGLCVQPNFPSQAELPSDDGHVEEISISGLEQASIALRNRPYEEIYEVLRHDNNFNMRLVDGALIQFKYLFREDKLLRHVLAFYPSPDLLDYQNNPEIYDNDVLYAEVLMKNVVTVPIRFDFDDDNFEDYIHPKSHFTIGQYKNCRIPVIAGLTPYRFLNFVLRAFYSTTYHTYCSKWKGSVPDFSLTATTKEQADLHWSYSMKSDL